MYFIKKIDEEQEKLQEMETQEQENYDKLEELIQFLFQHNRKIW